MSPRPRVEPLDVACPRCGVKSGYRCKPLKHHEFQHAGVWLKGPHSERRHAAKLLSQVTMNGGVQLDALDLLAEVEDVPPF